MNRSLAALAAAAMFAASVPTIGFADESSSSSSSTSSVSSSSVSSSSSTSTTSSSSVSSASSSSVSSHERGNEWKKPCDDLKGLTKAQCIVKHNPGKGNKKDRMQRRTEDKALRINADCASMEGAERLKCVRQNGKRGIKSFIMKKSKYDQEHTIRGVKVKASSSSESSED